LRPISDDPADSDELIAVCAIGRPKTADSSKIGEHRERASASHRPSISADLADLGRLNGRVRNKSSKDRRLVRESRRRKAPRSPLGASGRPPT